MSAVALGRSIAHAMQRSVAQRSRVPPGHAPCDQVPIVVDRHDGSGVTLLDETANPLPAAVTELNRRVVPQALQHVDDEDVRPREPDLAQQLVEQLARLAHERHALLVLVGPGRLADEHQVGVRVARAEDDGLPRRGQLRAAGTARRLPVDGLELLAALLHAAHRLEVNRGRGASEVGSRSVRGTMEPAAVTTTGWTAKTIVPLPIPSRYLVRELDRIPSELPERCAIVGAGRLGHALAAALRAAGVEVDGPLGRGARPQAEVVLLCVPDGEIRAAAEAIPARRPGASDGTRDAGPAPGGGAPPPAGP